MVVSDLGICTAQATPRSPGSIKSFRDPAIKRKTRHRTVVFLFIREHPFDFSQNKIGQVTRLGHFPPTYLGPINWRDHPNPNVLLQRHFSPTRKSYVSTPPFIALSTLASIAPSQIYYLYSSISFPPLTKEIRLKIFDSIISNSFPVRYYEISGTNFPDIP